MRTLLMKLFTDGQKTSYNKGDIILPAGETSDVVYYIVSGWVKVYKTDWNSGEKILMTLAPGDIFPCAWAITDTRHDVNFAALDKTQTLSIPMQQFQEVISSQNDYAHELLSVFAQQFYVLVEEVTNLQYHSAREKIILRLLSLAESFGNIEDDKLVIRKHISNEYVARSTSMSRETTSREMSRLVRERLIRHTTARIVIPDIAKLKRQVTGQDYNNRTRRTYHTKEQTM